MDLASHHVVREGSRGYAREVAASLSDFHRSFQSLALAAALSWHDIVSRYRGSLLGPGWITVTQAAMIIGIGVLYSQILRVDIHQYFPFVTAGLVLWSFISGTVVDACDTFTQASPILLQTSLPLPIFVWRVLMRNVIVLAHVIVVVLLVFLIFPQLNSNFIESVLGLVMTILNLSWVVLLISILSARFRDIRPIVQAVMQFALFMTPVFWSPDALGKHAFFLRLNPFYYMLQATRAPLLGLQVSPQTWTVLLVGACLGWCVGLSVYAAVRRRIVHFL